MKFEFFQLLSNEQAEEQARQEEGAKPPPDVPPESKVRYKLGIYQFRTKKEQKRRRQFVAGSKKKLQAVK